MTLAACISGPAVHRLFYGWWYFYWWFDFLLVIGALLLLVLGVSALVSLVFYWTLDGGAESSDLRL